MKFFLDYESVALGEIFYFKNYSSKSRETIFFTQCAVGLLAKLSVSKQFVYKLFNLAFWCSVQISPKMFGPQFTPLETGSGGGFAIF
jgi:hypothetical protein